MMEAFNIVTGRIAPILAANIDTDVIMPKQFLKGIDREGLAQGVFFDQRFLGSGEPNPDFVLNQPTWQGAKFLAVGPNFGCGSSREHAVWGLKQLGIRALVGTTFAGIFSDNCQRNGLLIIELETDRFSAFADHVASGRLGEISIDLPAQTIILPNKKAITFGLNPLVRENFLLGLDAIGNTLQLADQIREFERQHLKNNPWLC